MSDSVLSSAIDTASSDDVGRYIFAGYVGFWFLPSIDLKIRKWDFDRPMYISSSSSTLSSPIYPSCGRRESDGMDIYCMSLLVSGLCQESSSRAHRSVETEGVLVANVISAQRKNIKERG
jgi:hypothetical protein